MIMTIVESGGKLPKGSGVVTTAMLGYVVAASLVAAMGHLGAGLLVLAMGAVLVAFVDVVMWRAAIASTPSAAAAAGEGYLYSGHETLEPFRPSVVHGHYDPIRRETPAAPPSAADHVRALEVSSGADPAPAHAPAEPALAGGSAGAAANDDVAAAADIAAALREVGSDERADDRSEERADAAGRRPAGLPARPDSPDNLKAITGIGPGNEAKLNGLGIWRYDQIAGWTSSESAWVSAFLGFPGRIEREDWVGQARELARARATA